MPRLKAPQRKQQLVESAIELFARGGFEATTTASIAKAAGVTEPILYRHFKNKADLFIAIVRNVSQTTITTFGEASGKAKSPAFQLRAIGKAFPDHIKRHAREYNVLHSALTSSKDKRVIAVIKDHYTRLHRFFADVILSGQKSGDFAKSMDASAQAWHLVMAGLGYAALSLNVNQIDRPTIEHIIERMLAHLECR